MDDERTTVAAIKKYPLFSELGDDLIQTAIDDNWPQVLDDRLPTIYQERGSRLLTLSQLLVDNMIQTGGVQTASQMGESQTMFDWSKGNNPYLIDYNNLVRLHGYSRRRGQAFTLK